MLTNFNRLKINLSFLKITSTQYSKTMVLVLTIFKDKFETLLKTHGPRPSLVPQFQIHGWNTGIYVGIFPPYAWKMFYSLHKCVLS